MSNIGNENKQMWFASNKEVRLMIETEYLIAIIYILYILYYALLGITIIAIALIIALAVILSKSE
jgi:hypothetical protein